MMKEREPGRVLFHGQSESPIKLKGHAADTLVMQGIAEGYFEWETEHSSALDLELRAWIASTSAAPETTPIVRWRIEIGHGAAIAEYPPTRAPNVSDNLYTRAILPGRGLVLRTSARQLRIYFTGGLTLESDAVAENKIRVSVQPSVASELAIPLAQLALGEDQIPFPANANDFRIRMFDGSPFFAGAASVDFFSMLDQDIGSGDLAANGYGNWSPIPVMAASMQISSGIMPAMVEFR